MKASIVTIGDELLIGQVVDTNSSFIGKVLNNKGFYIQEKRAIADIEADIISTINDISLHSKICIVTGGLGPTKDDITRSTICKIWNDTLEYREAIGEPLKEWIIKRGYEPTPERMLQAHVPTTCKHLVNLVGTAPAMILEKNGCHFVFLPGVPTEVYSFFENGVSEWLDTFSINQYIVHNHVCTYGTPESIIAKRLSDFEDSLPAEFKLAYLPNFLTVRLRLTAVFSSKEEQYERLIEKKYTELKALVDDISLYYSDKPLVEEIASLLKSNGLTISTAESCTSGKIASTLTSISGSSQYFLGSILSYDNKIKEKLLQVKSEDLTNFGAVSQPVVEQMAKSVCNQTQSDYALSTSGISGPTGGTAEKPVGTTWIGLSDGTQTWSECVRFRSNRERNIEQTVTYAFVMLLKKIKEKHEAI